ncbi:MAG: hypothetical protein A2511_03780 [Deltaproteobacteria bacterium RIFOXYD12_FULL_50_9]|nr:MAG: hypothetical protein A2511_03780 [Deltaproteobacteria bacterium RIFOXYD12_FULL_50_9]
MIPKSDLPCWEIMRCENPASCLAHKTPDIPCWEIVRGLDDYRSAFNVCRDCIVYIIKQENVTLPSQEIEVILQTRGVCILS